MATGEPVLGEQSIPNLISRLTGDASELAHAEIALAKARVSASVRRYRTAAIYFAIAGTLVIAALVALLVGAILTLATVVGPGFATLIVVGVVLLACALLGLRGRSALSPGDRS